jgi:hypothetical protein
MGSYVTNEAFSPPQTEPMLGFGRCRGEGQSDGDAPPDYALSVSVRLSMYVDLP